MKIVRKGPLPGDTNPVEFQFRLNGEVEWRSSVDLRTYLYICQDWRDLRAANTRLTAEVERLRGIATEAVDRLKGIAREMEHPNTQFGGPMGRRQLGSWADEEADKLRAALSLPTPAQEATE